MNLSKTFLYFGYTVAVVCFSSGVIVLSGFLLPPHIPQKLRIMFGVVLLLYGIYRFVNLKFKQRQEDEGQHFL